MPSDDLLDLAKTTDADLYALLGVHEGSTPNEIQRAYRRATLSSHPDKVPENERDAAVERFHAISQAKDLLLDETAKNAYDQSRAAKLAKQRQRALFEGKRKSMVSDLEQRESAGIKRKRDELDAEARQEQELQRLAEDGRRRRMQREQALRREQEAEETTKKEEPVVSQKTHTPQGPIPALQRTVKVRWSREGLGVNVDKEKLAQMFARFGSLESCLLLKDRKVRLGENKKKSLVGTGIMVFDSIVGAHTAVEDARKQTGKEWEMLDSVEWAEGKEPDVLASLFSSPPGDSRSAEAPSTPAPASKPRPSFQGHGTPATPVSSFKAKEGISNPGGIRKVPSFASFSSATFNSPVSSPFGNGPQSPSLEEITMIRLKNAEKRRLEEQIRKEEAETSAAEQVAST